MANWKAAFESIGKEWVPETSYRAPDNKPDYTNRAQWEIGPNPAGYTYESYMATPLEQRPDYVAPNPSSTQDELRYEAPNPLASTPTITHSPQIGLLNSTTKPYTAPSIALPTEISQTPSAAPITLSPEQSASPWARAFASVGKTYAPPSAESQAATRLPDRPPDYTNPDQWEIGPLPMVPPSTNQSPSVSTTNYQNYMALPPEQRPGYVPPVTQQTTQPTTQVGSTAPQISTQTGQISPVMQTGGVSGYTVSTAQKEQAPGASTYSGRGYDATDWKVNEDQTVQGQIKKIIADNSPLSQAAETRSRQEANRSGLLNSSMAVQSGQQALYNSALPIATSDAQMYGSSAASNAAARSRASEFGAGAINQASRDNTSAVNQTNQFNAELATNAGQFNASQQNKGGEFNASEANSLTKAREQNLTTIQLANLDSTVKRELSNLDAGLRMRLAELDANTRKYATDATTGGNTQQLATNYMLSMQNGTNQRISAILTSTLTPEAKQNAINSELNRLDEGIQWLDGITGLNLSSLITYAP